jgi:chromosome segregation ATPase
MATLLAEVAGIKGTWQGKLNEISTVLEDVVTLKKGQLEVSKLHRQQEELHEELKVLSRMLKLREEEIRSLQTQLEQVLPLVNHHKAVLGVQVHFKCFDSVIFPHA